jgi:hypothetical protein
MPCPQPVQLVDAVYYDPWLTQFARRPAKQSKSRQPQDDPGPFADLLFWGLMRRFMPKALSFLLPGLALLFARSCPFPPPWTKFAQLRHDGREPRGEASQLSSNCRVSGYAAATFVIPGPSPPRSHSCIRSVSGAISSLLCAERLLEKKTPGIALIKAVSK